MGKKAITNNNALRRGRQGKILNQFFGVLIKNRTTPLPEPKKEENNG